MTQAIRNFAKSLESWLTHAMVNIPEEMLRVKVRVRGQPGFSLAPSSQLQGQGLEAPGWVSVPLPKKAIRFIPLPVPWE